MRVANVGGGKWGMRVEEAGRTHVQYQAISRIVVVPKPFFQPLVQTMCLGVKPHIRTIIAGWHPRRMAPDNLPQL